MADLTQWIINGGVVLWLLKEVIKGFINKTKKLEDDKDKGIVQKLDWLYTKVIDLDKDHSSKMKKHEAEGISQDEKISTITTKLEEISGIKEKLNTLLHKLIEDTTRAEVESRSVEKSLEDIKRRLDTMNTEIQELRNKVTRLETKLE